MVNLKFIYCMCRLRLEYAGQFKYKRYEVIKQQSLITL